MGVDVVELRQPVPDGVLEAVNQRMGVAQIHLRVHADVQFGGQDSTHGVHPGLVHHQPVLRGGVTQGGEQVGGVAGGSALRFQVHGHVGDLVQFQQTASDLVGDSVGFLQAVVRGDL